MFGLLGGLVAPVVVDTATLFLAATWLWCCLQCSVMVPGSVTPAGSGVGMGVVVPVFVLFGTDTLTAASSLRKRSQDCSCRLFPSAFP